MKPFLSLMLACFMLMSSCGRNRIFLTDYDRADARMEEIVSAIKDEDRDALKALFSQKALDEIDDWDSQVDSFFNFLEGDIISWEREDGIASDGSIEYGKRSYMIRFVFDIVTDADEYEFFLIDYTIDTIDPDNEGLYMLEVSKASYAETSDPSEWKSWQERLRAGISIRE